MLCSNKIDLTTIKKYYLKNSKPSIVVLLIALNVCLGFSQNQIPDSIHKKKMDSLVVAIGDIWDTDIDAAETIAESMLVYSNKNKFQRGIGQGHGMLATISSYKGNEGYSLWHSKKAIEAFEFIGNQILANKTRLNLGISYYETQDYEEALVQTNKALEYFKEIKDTTYLASTYTSLGMIMSNMDVNFTTTDTILKKAILMSEISKDTFQLCNSLSLRAHLWADNDFNLNSASDLVEKSIVLLNTYDPEDGLLQGYNYFVKAVVSLKQGVLSKALIYNDSALLKYKRHEYMSGLKTVYESRVKILDAMSEYKKSAEAYQILGAYRDTLTEKRKETQYNRLKIEYETDRVLAEKERAETEAKFAKFKSRQNMNYLIGVVIVSLCLLSSVLFYVGHLRSRRKTEAITNKLKQTALDKRNTESELKALKSQMNPHFIFNSLNAIQDYIIDNKKGEASEYLGRFADLIRRYLMQSNAEYISLHEEIESLKIYLSLEALRFDDNFDYHISQSHALTQKMIHIPTMLVQPYVENAIRHGLLHKTKKRKLLVSFSSGAENTIICVVEDNGVGRKNTSQLKSKKDIGHKSFAEKATSDRLALFNKKINENVGVVIEDLYHNDKPYGTKVVLTIPITN